MVERISQGGGDVTNATLNIRCCVGNGGIMNDDLLIQYEHVGSISGSALTGTTQDWLLAV